MLRFTYLLLIALLPWMRSPAWAQARSADSSLDLLVAELLDGDGDRVEDVRGGLVAGTADLDANGDQRITVADVTAIEIGLPAAATFTPTAMPTMTPPALPSNTASPSDTATAMATPSRTATATPTTSATPSPSAMPTRTATSTPTATFSPTQTATPTASATSSPTPTVATTPGLLFDGPPSTFVPHGAGDTWTYEITGSTNDTRTIAISSADPGGSFVASTQTSTSDYDETYVDDGASIILSVEVDVLRNAKTTCTPALVRLVVPVIAGQVTTTISSCEVRSVPANHFLGSFAVKETISPIEILPSLTVPAGTYHNVLHVEGTRTLGKETNEVYLAPGVGIVRRDISNNSGSTSEQLTGGTVGGQPVQP